MAGAPTGQAGEASSSTPGWTEKKERRKEVRIIGFDIINK